MAEEIKKEQKAEAAQAETAGRKLKKKKSRPTNCLQSNKRIRRKDWYYRDGKYFANKKCYKLYVAQEAKKAQDEQAKKAAQEAPAATQG